MTKDGRFTYRQIFSYLSDGQYPPRFSKADKLALRKRAKFLEQKVLTFITVVEVRTYIFCV